MKEEIAIPKVTESEKIDERLKNLESRVELLEIIAKAIPETEPKTKPKAESVTKKIIQINVKPTTRLKKLKDGSAVTELVKKGKTYFCETPEEQRIFSENNPGVKTETYNIEMPDYVADKRLNDPENKKQFVRS